MSDAALDGIPSESGDATPGGPKRRAKPKRRHTVGKVLLATLVALAIATGLSVVYLYRHLNGNIQVLDPTDQLSDRPSKLIEGPKGPLNILVMGSDSRDGVSIPRDLLVDRPECTDADGNSIPGGSGQMWNAAYSLGGPACTIQQFEQLTDIRVDHFVVVDFEGFRGMVDAIGGVEMCIPEDIEDPAHDIHIPAGTRKLKGFQALNYVRERYVVGDGSDVGRMKRQQAFIASMAHQVVTAGTLARPDRLIRFLDSATKSLTVDPGLKNLMKLAGLGGQLKDIGLDNIQFITIPIIPDPGDPNRLAWKQPEAGQVWQRLLKDQPLTKRLSSGVISAGNIPGKTQDPSPSATPTDTPSVTPSETASPSQTPTTTPPSTTPEEQQALASAGLCV